MAQAEPIPLRNIWLLFLYAADLAQFKGRFDHDVETARDLPGLIARLLAVFVEERLRRNLSRGYRVRAANLSRVRGRINLLATEAHQLMDRGQIACSFEEHTMDTPRNRLVRAALDKLAGRVSDMHLAHRCRVASGDFARMGVTAARPSRTEMATDQIGRNEVADRLMVALATMVFETVIPTEAVGNVTGWLPDAPDQLIRRLFERAVGNALRLELSPFGWTIIQGRRINWPHHNASAGMATILPGMQTDIELNHCALGRRIVIDTKFTHIFTSSSYREAILKSGYLYQLYSYLRTQERANDEVSLRSEGMLLHPQIGGAVDEEMSVQGHVMRFKTIDLLLPPDCFETELRNIVIKTLQPVEVMRLAGA